MRWKVVSKRMREFQKCIVLPIGQSIYGTLQASCDSFQGDEMHSVVYSIISSHYLF